MSRGIAVSQDAYRVDEQQQNKHSAPSIRYELLNSTSDIQSKSGAQIPGFQNLEKHG